MTSWNRVIFRVTGLLWGESTGNRWIPLKKASDAELWCLLWTNGWASDLRCHRAHYDITAPRTFLNTEIAQQPWFCRDYYRGIRIGAKQYSQRIWIMREKSSERWAQGQNFRHFATDEISPWMQISLPFVLKPPIDNIAALVQVTVWRCSNDKSLHWTYHDPIHWSIYTSPMLMHINGSCSKYHITIQR